LENDRYICQVEVKSKFIHGVIYLSTAPWRRMGEWRYISTILDLGTRWRWVISFTLLPLYPLKSSNQCPFYTRFGGSQSRSGHCGIERWLLGRPTRISSETSVDFQRTTRRYIPEDRTPHNHRSENLKSHFNQNNILNRWRSQRKEYCNPVLAIRLNGEKNKLLLIYKGPDGQAMFSHQFLQMGRQVSAYFVSLVLNCTVSIGTNCRQTGRVVIPNCSLNVTPNKTHFDISHWQVRQT
jgi:hypothetical protein